jgi:biotin carboxyl carrier protein
MPGLVEKILVAPGAHVEAEEPLCVVVAMKMEVVIQAPVAGRVGVMCVEEGGKVVEGALLCRIE